MDLEKSYSRIELACEEVVVDWICLCLNYVVQLWIVSLLLSRIVAALLKLCALWILKRHNVSFIKDVVLAVAAILGLFT